MNETIRNQLEHRTIRKFKNKKVEDEIINTLFDIYNRAATSTGLSQTSIIRITDEEIKEEIMKVSTQKYLKDCPELWIFVLDIYRSKKILEEKNENIESYKDMDRFFQGFTDALIGAQNMVVGLESLGLGAVYFGSILNDYDKIIEILKLPKYTFPVLGLGFGYPDEMPQLKPRMDKSIKLFENEYKVFDNYLDELKEYDESMTEYYDLRENGKRSDTFTDQVVKRYKGIVEKRKEVVRSIRKQGFEI